MFHYGHDMPLLEAMQTVLERSPQPVEIRRVPEALGTTG
jgi:hypothetical protein